jgi:hypothetical protein
VELLGIIVRYFFLLFSWNQIEKMPMQSLTQIAIPSDADRYTFFILLGSSLLSFAVSHLVYATRARA